MIIKNKLTMRTFLPLIHRSIGAIALLTTVPAFAQSPCDELTVFPPRYDAFDPERIEVWVNNQSTEIFSYPNFVLLNDQGQVLASEEVTFFGIGGTGSHYMQVTPGVSFPANPSEGDYALRLDYWPNRLFRYDGARWIKIEDSVRTNLNNG